MIIEAMKEYQKGSNVIENIPLLYNNNRLSHGRAKHITDW